jgi:hypothetical protein
VAGDDDFSTVEMRRVAILTASATGRATMGDPGEIERWS